MRIVFALFISLFLLSARSSAEPTYPRNFFDDLLAPRKGLNKSLLGVNAFANDSRFGSIKQQFQEVRNTLGIKRIRLIFAWNDQVQATPDANIFFGYYDELAKSLPRDTDAIVVLTGIPTWMRDSRNWIDNDPRHTFVEKWVKPVVSRYKANTKIIGWQIWNEPNMDSNTDNRTLDIMDSPTNYIELIADAYGAIRQITPRQKIINGSTTAINQNYPETLDYNKELLDSGILNYVNVFAIHFYGKQLERVVLSGGIADTLKNISKPIWVTESGEQGVLKQQDYARRIFPFLLSQIPNIKRIYIYQFTDSSNPNKSYGLKTLSSINPISDLYIYLRSLK